MTYGASNTIVATAIDSFERSIVEARLRLSNHCAVAYATDDEADSGSNPCDQINVMLTTILLLDNYSNARLMAGIDEVFLGLKCARRFT